jgi:hypothetical protein
MNDRGRITAAFYSWRPALRRTRHRRIEWRGENKIRFGRSLAEPRPSICIAAATATVSGQLVEVEDGLQGPCPDARSKRPNNAREGCRSSVS